MCFGQRLGEGQSDACTHRTRLTVLHLIEGLKHFLLLSIRNTRTVIAHRNPETFTGRCQFNVDTALGIFHRITYQVDNNLTDLFAIHRGKDLTFREIKHHRDAFQFGRACKLPINIAYQLIDIAFLQIQLYSAVLHLLKIKQLIGDSQKVIDIPVDHRQVLGIPSFSFIFQQPFKRKTDQTQRSADFVHQIDEETNF